jgi:hypothetical protein
MALQISGTLPVENAPSLNRFFVYFAMSYDGAEELWKRHPRLVMIWIAKDPDDLQYLYGEVFMLINYVEHNCAALLNDVNNINEGKEEGTYEHQPYFLEKLLSNDDERRSIGSGKAFYIPYEEDK